MSLLSNPAARKTKQPLRRLIFALVIAILGIGLLELTFRLVLFPEWTELSPSLHVEHPVYMRFTAPNARVRQFDPPSFDAVVTTNSGGFRDRETGFDEDLKGVWICGGSTTFGSGLEDEEIFSSLLENLGYRSANLSAEGSQIIIESRIIRDLAAKGHRPRAVICVITTPGGIKPFGGQLAEFETPLPTNDGTAANDISKAAAQVFLDNLDSVVPYRSPSYLVSGVALKTRLIKNSAVYGALKFGVGQIPALHQLSLDLGLRNDADLHISGEIGLFEKRERPEIKDRIEGMAAFTQRLQEWVTLNLGVPFGLVILPSHHQVHPYKFQKFLKHSDLDPEGYDISLANTRFADALRRRGVPVFDASDDLIAANDIPLTFANNAHLNRDGHRIVAKSIARWLETGLGVPPLK